jgi:hypothetical protein
MVFKSKQLAIHYFSKLYSAIADFIFEELGLVFFWLSEFIDHLLQSHHLNHHQIQSFRFFSLELFIDFTWLFE